MTAAKNKAQKPKDVAQDVHSEVRDLANSAYDRAKEAMPSLDEVSAQVGSDLRSTADDATSFVQRNPAVSIAAAAGIGVLIGILATKRS